MKIFTNIGAWKGIEVAFSDQRIAKFDNEGAAELEASVAQGLLKDYPDMLFSKEVPKTVEQEKESEKYIKVIKDLQISIQERDKTIKDQKLSFEKQLEDQASQKEEWRKKCEEILEDNPNLKKVSQQEYDKVVEELEKFKSQVESGGGASVKLSQEDLEGIKVLVTSNADILKGMAKSLKIPEGEYNNLSKVDLVIMLIDKTVNANSNV
ncbi:MAG: hypothetical protein WC008_05480 [Bacilli bacterium]